MTARDDDPRPARVRAFLTELQEALCSALEREDGGARFRREVREGERGGLARPRVLEGGAVIERCGVNFSHALGDALPPAASERRPELAGRGYEALSLSLIVHPRNPYAPTAHMNVRSFFARDGEDGGRETLWWFGGGFDLTPCYGFEEDARHWHRTARAACEPFGPELYPRLKEQCDRYFFLAHRGEPRGIGGLFFDDWSEGGFEPSFALLRSVAEHFLPAYQPILARRKDTPWGEREREFQLWRRGRYVEFNLLQDRGTRFGLQAGGRSESILVSLPPLASWRYGWEPEPGTPEARLRTDFLRPRDWV
jgi:coproporphyrinogen III oxidase